jgi:2-dehydro-3-deoxygluconokinase
MIELKKDYKWAMVVPTSMGVRITPVDRQPVHCTGTFMMHVTSAEKCCQHIIISGFLSKCSPHL